MKLLVDLGNSRVHLARSLETGVVQALHVAAYKDRGLTAALHDFRTDEVVDGVYIASVGEVLLRNELDNWLREQGWPPAQYVQSEATACGVTNAYQQPWRLGVDRWLAIIASHQRAQVEGAGGSCVVDAGTALTLDVVSAEGQHAGGLIAVGVGRQRHNLLTGTARVRSDALPNGLELLGRDSGSALAHGTVHAALGLIERVSSRLATEQGIRYWYLTGGEAELLYEYLPGSWQLVPTLVLEGLAHVADAMSAP